MHKILNVIYFYSAALALGVIVAVAVIFLVSCAIYKACYLLWGA